MSPNPGDQHRHRKDTNVPVDVIISRFGDGWIVDVHAAGKVAPIEDRQVPTAEIGERWARACYRGRINELEVIR